MTDTKEYYQQAVEHAPHVEGNPQIRGWWTPNQWYLCSKCVSKIIGRGCRLPNGSEPVYHDQPEPYGVCCCCETN